MPTQTAFAAVLADPGLPPVEGLRAWNNPIRAARFAVIATTFVSLVDALEPIRSPSCRNSSVRRSFRLRRVRVANPPRTRATAFYGAEFPDFIEGFTPAREVTYLADVARLEYLRVRAYHAADARYAGRGRSRGPAGQSGRAAVAVSHLAPVAACAFLAVRRWVAMGGTSERAGGFPRWYRKCQRQRWSCAAHSTSRC